MVNRNQDFTSLSYSDWKGTTGPGATLREIIKEERRKTMPTPVATKEQKIAPEVMTVLQQGTWTDDGLGFVMPQLDRKLYLKTAEVLKACGGKWDRKAGATVFADPDAVSLLREAARTGVYIDPKQAYQFFETPAAVVRLMLDCVDATEHQRVLEPSAGKGAIIVEAIKILDEDSPDAEIHAVELNPDCVSHLKRLSGSPSQPLKEVHEGDFLAYSPDQLGFFDLILMNPPFSKGQELQHVRHAYNFLAPDGWLAAIMTPAMNYRRDRKYREFREWFEESGGVHYELPDNSFASSGTNVSTILAVLDKSGYC